MNVETIKELLTDEQLGALERVSKRFNVKVDFKQIFIGGFGLPDDWIVCNIGNKITVGISPTGEVSS